MSIMMLMVPVIMMVEHEHDGDREDVAGYGCCLVG